MTRPTPQMRRAMSMAEVGDDGYGEDPTVNRLETAFAARMGKEAAVFLPSGTMSNQVALRVLAQPGSSVVAGRTQHIVAYELGAAALNASIQFHTVDDSQGAFAADEVRRAREATEYHHPAVSLVCTESTHMASGGIPWELSELEEVQAAASGLPVHLDGARIFNAEVATGVPVSVQASTATTVTACLSKGLCAPVGSLLAGPLDLMTAARTERKRLGGAMRQAGILAAAGLIALDQMVDRLAEDHIRAKRLAEAVADRWPGAGFSPGSVRTNIVLFPVPSVEKVIHSLAAEGVLVGAVAPGMLRLVTHHDIDDAGIERARHALASVP